MSYEHPRAWIDDGYMWLRRDQQAGITDSDYAEAMGTDEPACVRCNQPLDYDGYGDPVGGMHYGCAHNESEMWGTRRAVGR